jgi:hypothetical protein
MLIIVKVEKSEISLASQDAFSFQLSENNCDCSISFHVYIASIQPQRSSAVL